MEEFSLDKFHWVPQLSTGNKIFLVALAVAIIIVAIIYFTMPSGDTENKKAEEKESEEPEWY